MITPNQTFTCVCQKCKGQWMTQSNKLPAVCRHCKTTKWNDDYTPMTAPKKTMLDHVKDLTPAQRMTLFESFELCCGMNIGQCICEEEVIETAPVQAIAKPVTAPAGMNDAMARFLAKMDSKPVIEEVEEIVEDWKFTKASPQFADNGCVYRQQFRVSNGKPVYRNVEVDCDDLDTLK